MKSISAIAVAICILLAAAPAGAQERQVPLDEQGRIEVVDASLARQLGFWVDEFPGFAEARLFEQDGGAFILEITRQVEGERRRERIPLTPAEVADLRATISARMLEGRALPPGEQEGRYLLLGQSTLAGLAFYGLAIPEIVGADGTGAAGLYLLTAATSFFAPFALTQNRPVTFGMANLSRYGITRGAVHGSLAYTAVAGEREHCTILSCLDEPRSEQAQLATAVAFSIGEGVGGYLWARNAQMTAGTANAITTFGDAGVLAGAGTARLLGIRRSARVQSAMSLAGAAAGIVGGRALAARRDYTWGDADLLYTGGMVGAFTGLATAAVSGFDHERAVIGLAMAGGGAGLYIADRMVDDTDFTLGQAVLNRLGTLAGGLAGASVGVLLEDEDVAIAGAALGAIGGYLFTYSALAPDARAGRGERFSRWDVQVSPQGLLGFASGDAEAGAAPVPMLNLTYRLGSSAGAR